MCTPACCGSLVESGSLIFPAKINHKRGFAGKLGIGHDLGQVRLEATGGYVRAGVGKGGKEKAAASALGRSLCVAARGDRPPFRGLLQLDTLGGLHKNALFCRHLPHRR